MPCSRITQPRSAHAAVDHEPRAVRTLRLDDDRPAVRDRTPVRARAGGERPAAVGARVGADATGVAASASCPSPPGSGDSTTEPLPSSTR